MSYKQNIAVFGKRSKEIAEALSKALELRVLDVGDYATYLTGKDSHTEEELASSKEVRKAYLSLQDFQDVILIPSLTSLTYAPCAEIISKNYYLVYLQSQATPTKALPALKDCDLTIKLRTKKIDTVIAEILDYLEGLA